MKTQTYQVRHSGKSTTHQKKSHDYTSSSFPIQTQQETPSAPTFNMPKGSMIANIQRSIDSDNYPYPTTPIPIQTKLTVGKKQENQDQDQSLPTIQRNFEENLNQAKGSGSPLDSEFRAKIEPKMGADFSGVKVHTDSTANELSQSIQAKAFTTGNNIFFKQGEYNPHSQGGQELLAHELTHVVQQNGGNVTDQSVQKKPDQSVSISSAPQGTIQRIVDAELDKLWAIEFKETSRIAKITGNKQFLQQVTQKQQEAIDLLEQYNNDIHSGQAPTEEQNKQLRQAFTILIGIVDLIDQEKPDNPNWQQKKRIIWEVAQRIQQERTLLKTYNQIQDTEMVGALGHGCVNTVYEVLFGNGWKAVWKRDQSADTIDDQTAELLDWKGFSTETPNLGSRNIAMYRLDQLLGTGVIPRTERATYEGNAGIVMDFVNGPNLGTAQVAKMGANRFQTNAPAPEILNSPTQERNFYVKPQIQQQLSNLRLLDVIAHQVDRHEGNIHVVVDEKQRVVGIKGIDNDFCFGITSQDQSAVLNQMPKFIDSQVAHHIVTIEPDQIRQTLAGLLTDPEIEQTVERFNTVKTYVMQLLAWDNYFDKKEADKTAEQQGYIVSKWNLKTYKRQAALVGADSYYAEKGMKLFPGGMIGQQRR